MYVRRILLLYFFSVGFCIGASGQDGKLSAGIQSLDYQLLRACATRDTESIIRLIKLGADVKTTYEKIGVVKSGSAEATTCPLIAFSKSSFAIKSNDLMRVLEAFKAAQVDFEQADFRGRTAVYLAVENRQKELVRLLLDAGASPNATTNNRISCADEIYNLTPLHIAGWSEEVWKLLLQHGADLHAKDSRGRTPVELCRVTVGAGDYELPK